MRILTALVILISLHPAARAEGGNPWKPVETVERYAVSGQTEMALYASIGERGPMVRGGKVRAIAYTDFKLTWKRRYENPNGGCLLSEARPNLTIVYRLPKPAEKLPAPVQANWDRFYAGIVAHERNHGDFIMAMVKRIEAETAGLRAENDPDCRKVRAELNRRLKAASQEKNSKDAAFDRAEMREGGTVRRLVIAFVNGR